jgi:urea transporter
MQTKFWVRRTVLAIVWGLAVSTWASIGHHLFGMPDVGLPLVLATMTFIMVRPALRTSVRARGSNASDSALHGGVPTA